ncbi:MAG TPA: hypothetical protein VLC28_14840 [Flavitalea sp.]|nr:hypothetical protein [Flavitalea sp.]
MELTKAVNNVFLQLEQVILQVTEEEYSKPCTTLFKNTIGQHVRHVIELFQCLESGYDDAVVNYEKRPRDKRIETDKGFAQSLLTEIYQNLDRPDKSITLEASYDDLGTVPIRIHTNYFREIAYNLEHTIHHMALIRVGVAEVTNLQLPDTFGVASSTVKYRKECAQ